MKTLFKRDLVDCASVGVARATSPHVGRVTPLPLDTRHSTPDTPHVSLCDAMNGELPCNRT